jgi:hypothetical protein
MFICDDCLKRRGMHSGMFKSIGICEDCGEHKSCSDIPSGALRELKESVNNERNNSRTD